MLVLALRDVGSGGSFGAGPDDVLVQTMCEYVRKHVTDRELTVPELARRHHLSVRQVYVLFARIDVTPAAFIREQRLLNALTLLRDPRLLAQPTSVVAGLAGFDEPRTFERAFQRKYGVTPLKWRRDNHSG